LLRPWIRESQTLLDIGTSTEKEFHIAFFTSVDLGTDVKQKTVAIL